MEDVVKRFLQVGAGAGYGDGAGCGDGCGAGCGAGYGDGDGDGDGRGYGYGIKSINARAVHRIDGVATILYAISLDDDMNGLAVGRVVRGDLTLEKTYIAKRGGFFAHGTTIAEAVADAEKKMYDDKTVDERVDAFVARFPSTDMFASGAELFRWHHTLTGSCKQGRETFCKNKGISLDAEFTILEFIKLTENAYGAEAIKALKERYIALQQQGGAKQEDGEKETGYRIVM